MDDYDFNHKAKYEYILNIYANSNIENSVNKFIEESKFEMRDYSIKEIKEEITRMQNGLKIIDYRHVTNIGSRVVVYNDGTPIWILIQVWRGGLYL